MRILPLILFCLAGLLQPAFAKTTPLGNRPDWSKLDKFQETITRERFIDLLARIYAPGDAAVGVIAVTPTMAKIQTAPGKAPYLLRFAKSPAAPARYWRPRSAIPKDSGKPLAGVKITIDPGHIGGKWAQMEERWFQIGNSKPVTEGDMTLRVAKLVKPRLEALGAQVTLTRSGSEPITSRRPEALRKLAVESLREKGDKATKFAITKESERLFYRTAEIRRRAVLVNDSLKPDLVLALHFNAEAWGNPAKPSLVTKNHAHFLVTGGWSNKELSYEDQRYEMLVKLLNGSHEEEVAASKALAKTTLAATGLPPYIYQGGEVRIPGSDYIWARNLLANRLFECPVVYAEPYVMNSREVFQRIQAGDYEGKKKIAGASRKSIYREYAD
ncbi:MAG: N-acetylmuramoyl-L-alanine amidase, partial [Spartobacteria bacterium]